MTRFKLIITALLIPLLIPIAGIYRIIINIRNRLYDTGFRKQVFCSVPVISVGNITLGGTGKTPLVIELANWLTRLGYSPGIISRGYKRSSRGQQIVKNRTKILQPSLVAGDEPFLMATKTDRVVIIVDADRVAAAATAVNRFGCDILIADDAFQHRRLGRNLDIVLWDIDLNPNRCRLLPAGRLREPLQSLQRADILFISRTDKIPDEYYSTLQKVHPALFMAPLSRHIRHIRSLSDNTEYPQDQLTGVAVLAFCGLGNPNQFFNMITLLTGVPPVQKTFPDHYRYTTRDIQLLTQQADQSGCRFLVTTRKDAVNLPESANSLANLLVIDIEYIIDEKSKAAILHKLPPKQLH